jgi:subtilase family serine protease
MREIRIERRWTALLVGACVCLVACSEGSTAGALGSSEEDLLVSLAQIPFSSVCTTVNATGARCLAKVRADVVDASAASSSTRQLSPLGPVELQSAYNVPAAGVANPLVALIESGDYPNLEADLSAYRSNYGLPPCTAANGCLRKVDQSGGSNYPQVDNQWAVETALDVDMVSAVCPSCSILVLEADPNDPNGMFTANSTAAAMGATVVSNSWGINEDLPLDQLDPASQQQLAALWQGSAEPAFMHPGVAYFAASGDNGFGNTAPAGAGYPATSPNVTAVGGTVLARSSNARGWVEGTWGNAANDNGGTGSGCSQFFAKPGFQTDTGCSKRMANDVAALGGAPGVNIYVTGGQFGLEDGGVGNMPDGWNPMGGTSAASPLVAAIYAHTGLGAQGPKLSYSAPDAFYDVVKGVNGKCDGLPSYFCKSGVGYDGPTGNGTPNGQALATLAGQLSP